MTFSACVELPLTNGERNGRVPGSPFCSPKFGHDVAREVGHPAGSWGMISFTFKRASFISSCAGAALFLALDGATAQDKGTLTPQQPPPLANAEDPATPAKELFGR